MLYTSRMHYPALLNVIKKATLNAAKGVKRDFGEIDKLQVSKKGTADFVTSADIRTEAQLVEELTQARPEFSFKTEEQGKFGPKGASYRFVIDPIDGTTNFIHAIPYMCISVAAQEKTPHGWQTLVGVIYDPIQDELFTAIKGEGAQLNGFRLRVSARSEDWLFSTTSPRTTRKNFEETIAAFTRVSGAGAVLRCSGSAALDLAYVAAGRLDGTWYHYLNVWDMAAGALLVSEAGGRVSQINGDRLTDHGCSIVAASEAAYAPLSKALVG
jgi:myo-inositol-1(or 4)-monophosphatase